MQGNTVEWDITGTLPLMLMLNGLSPDDTSTVLKDMTVPKITKEYWPVVVNASPEGYRIFDFHIAIHTLSCFCDEQESLAEMNISLGLLHKSVKPNSLVITHQPRYQKGAPKKRKMVSNEVRDAITMNSTLLKKFSFLVLLNKYDVFGMVHDPILIQPAVQEIENLGDMIVVSATTQQRLMARDIARRVSPPHVLIRFPPIYAISDVLRSAANFGPVETHQMFQQSGMLLVKYQASRSVTAMYGATLPGPVYFTSGTTEHDSLLTVAERLEHLRLSELPNPILNAENLAVAGKGGGPPALALPDIGISTSRPISQVPSILPSGGLSPRESDGTVIRNTFVGNSCPH